MSRDATHPNSVESERALLGAFIQWPELMREIELDVADLWRDDHRHMYRLLLTMRAEGAAIDLVTLPERVMRTGEQGKYGGVAYAIELPEYGQSRANVSHYAQVIREKADQRRLMAIGHELIAAASAHTDQPATLAETARAKLATIGAAGGGEWINLADAMDSAVEAMAKREAQGTGRSGLTTGFPALDAMLSGLCPGKLYLVAARPAMGKTGLALQFAEGMAADESGQGAVGIFSMEMDAHELAERSILGAVNVRKEAARAGYMTVDEWDLIAASHERLQGLPIAIQDRPARSLADIVQGARRLEVHHTGGVRALVIDYLQLMHGDGENQALRIGAISGGLKSLARELGVPIILLSQLNRECEKRADKRPMMSDIRDSGSVEQDCDCIIFIYRHEVYAPEDALCFGIAEAIVRKQRNGPTGTVKLKYREGRFADMAQTGTMGHDGWPV